MRFFSLDRNTRETQISLSLCLEGSGKADVATGCGFLDHMLELFARHGGFDLRVSCRGDSQVDYHHTVEDVGICLGTAFAGALGDKRGICRYGQSLLPMDETLVLCAADISGRAFLGWAVELPSPRVGDFDTELGQEFWQGFVRSCPMALHLRLMCGGNTHHILEACFKAAGRALGQAAAIDPRRPDDIPSTKGLL